MLDLFLVVFDAPENMTQKMVGGIGVRIKPHHFLKNLLTFLIPLIDKKTNPFLKQLRIFPVEGKQVVNHRYQPIGRGERSLKALNFPHHLRVGLFQGFTQSRQGGVGFIGKLIAVLDLFLLLSFQRSGSLMRI